MRHIFIYLLPTLVMAGLLIYYMKPITHWMGRQVTSLMGGAQTASKKAVVIATVEQVNGQALVRRSFQQEILKKGAQIYNYDRVEVDAQSQLTLNFLSGYSLQFAENSQFLVELLNPQKKDQSLTYIYFKYGRHKIIKKGQKRHLYIIRNSKRFTPEQTIPLQLPLEISSTSPSQRAGSPNSLKNGRNPTPLPKDQGVLSTEYIESRVREKRSLFEACLQNSLRDKESSSGHLLVGFSILTNGRTQNVKTVQSKLTNEALKRCVLNVFERLQFKPFPGNQPIDFTYPLHFK